jgi:hypothetical protein
MTDFVPLLFLAVIGFTFFCFSVEKRKNYAKLSVFSWILDVAASLRWSILHSNTDSSKREENHDF